MSFCPERIVQGHAMRELKELPHVISSFSREGREYCAALFRKLSNKIVEVGVREAELAKLFNNSLALHLLCGGQPVLHDERKLRRERPRSLSRAMTEGYARGQSIPRPGFTAGPCLLKDTMQLARSTAIISTWATRRCR